jgi:uncharacterized phiE125 gp8 family phage protein
MTCYLLAGPAAEPVSLAEAKAWLRLDGEAEDGLVATLISAARIHVESVTGRALVAQSWRLVLDGWPAGRAVSLPVGPLIALTAITAFDADGEAQEVETAGVLADATAHPPRLYFPPALVLPAARAKMGIEIDFLAGHGEEPDAVPADLRRAVLGLVAHWFENRDAVMLAGAGAVVPEGLAAALAPYRRARL